MPSDYTGNPLNEHGVAKPSLNAAVAIRVPVDLVDDLGASAFNLSPEVLADWIEFLKTKHKNLTGVHPWDSTRTYTVGNLVTDPDNHRMYRALDIVGNTDKQPGSDSGTYWARCDFSEDEIQSSSSKHTDAGSPTGITCTRGASVIRANMVVTGNTLKQIMLEVQNVPFDNSITIDLSGSTAKFTSLFYGGTASMLSGGYQYGGQVGLGLPTSGHDVFTLWAKKGAGDAAISCTVGIMIWGT